MRANEKLRAVPKRHNRAVQHSIRGIVDGKFTALPSPKADVIEIEADERAFYMFRHSQEGEPLGDTWHETLQEAFAQAEFEFGINAEEWATVKHMG